MVVRQGARPRRQHPGGARPGRVPACGSRTWSPGRGNPAWQAAYRTALHQRFAFSPASFVKRVVIGALEPASMWINDTDLHLAAIQASTITNVLSQTPDS